VGANAGKVFFVLGKKRREKERKKFLIKFSEKKFQIKKLRKKKKNTKLSTQHNKKTFTIFLKKNFYNLKSNTYLKEEEIKCAHPTVSLSLRRCLLHIIGVIIES